ncbi:MAG: Ldh family oxidoreductase [Planctomycetaceae bacterium]
MPGVSNGMLSIIIDRSFFGSDSEFFPEVNRYIEFVKSSRTVNPNGEILMPGEIEHRMKLQRMEHGIELDDVTLMQILKTCQSLDIEHGFDVPEMTEGLSRNDHVVMPGCEPAPMGLKLSSKKKVELP